MLRTPAGVGRRSSLERGLRPPARLQPIRRRGRSGGHRIRRRADRDRRRCSPRSRPGTDTRAPGGTRASRRAHAYAGRPRRQARHLRLPIRGRMRPRGGRGRLDRRGLRSFRRASRDAAERRVARRDVVGAAEGGHHLLDDRPLLRDLAADVQRCVAGKGVHRPALLEAHPDATTPASTRSVLPVIASARSLAAKSATRATSSGVTTRPSGARAAITSRGLPPT